MLKVSLDLDGTRSKELIDWLDRTDPNWGFNYRGDKQDILQWYKGLVVGSGVNQTITWHLVLSPEAAMLARLTWDVWQVKAVDA